MPAPKRIWLAVVLVLCTTKPSAGQEGTRDDSHVENVVHKAVADEFSSEILTNRTRAYLSCASGEMVVKINFTEPFRGITYVDYDKTSPCKFYGDGRKYYELRIPLKGCGTKQEAPRVFINNIIVRFHRSLELEEDEIKTIICRYPPPLAPPPTNVIAPILEPPPIVPPAKHPKLSEVELLLIICALLFLTLLLLGIGIAYYCLKKRNIKVVRRRKALSSAPASEITKLSGSTLGTLSMFDPIRIPRAIAQSTSGSEAALLTSVSSQQGSGERSDTIPSDYPSESPSSVSDVEEIAVQRTYDNAAYIPDPYPIDQERSESLSSVPITTIVKPPAPKLKAKVANENLLHTITEREDMLESETLNRKYARVSVAPNLLSPTPRYTIEPPVYTRIRKKIEPPPPSLCGSIPDNDNRSHSEILEAAETRSPPSISSYAPSLYGSIPDNDNWSHSELEAPVSMKPYVKKPKLQMATTTDYFINTQNITEIQEDVLKKKQVTHPPAPHSPPSPIPSTVPESEIPDTSMSEIIAVNETALVPRKPKITIHSIDDVFLTTEHETIATEHVTKHTRDTIEQLKMVPPTPMSPPPTWDVTIRHYPPAEMPKSPTEPDDVYRKTWETISEVNGIYRTSTEAPPASMTSPQPSTPSKSPSPVTPASSTPNWDVLFRVISPPTIEGVDELTPDIKKKWRTVITTDTTFRTLIQEATTTEEYIRISRDVRYESLFERRTWEVIIRVLTHPDYLQPTIQPEPLPEVRPPRYKKNPDQPRRKSSLPPVRESDIPADLRSLPDSHRTSRSNSLFDLRSMTEIDVDFSRAERDSLWSVDTGYTVRTTQSIAERSTSEFLEDVPIASGRRPSMSNYHPGLERSSSEIVHSPNSVFRDDNASDVTSDFGDLPRFDVSPSNQTMVERSSEHFTEDDGVHRTRVTTDHMRVQRSGVIITNPLLRAADRVSSIGETEEIKSVTETDVYDWLR